MTEILRPARDMYGPEADRSNLADYLELLALADTPMTRADLADFLVDMTWVVRSRELYVNASDEEPTEDDQESGAEITPQEQWAEEIFAICELRGALLGERYPFQIDGTRVCGKPPDEQHDAYLALLSITVAHHYNVPLDAGLSAERAFETVTAEVMSSRGLTTCNLGALGRETTDFRDKVTQAGKELDVLATPQAAISRTHANDEKVDVVSNLSWGDHRGGHWLYIGQSTVGESGTWQGKMMQPRVHQWRDLMGSILLPRAYLAVPHHVEDTQLLDLIRGDARLVLDRLRLARYLNTVPSEAQSITMSVRSASPYDPRI